MPATILNGTNIASEVTEKLKTEIQSIKQEHPAFQPHLAILQVGNRIESNLYVKIKQKTCERIGLTTDYFKFPADVTQDVVMSKILELNDDAHVHGILLQLPLDCLHPIDADTCIQAISRSKDVDGLHPFNSGLLARGNLRDGFIPCTAKACLTIIEKTGIDLRGKQAVVIGRSKLVGSPMADLLKWRDATVTTCHSKTKNLPSIVEQADVLVVAVGHANLVKGEWLKPGAIVVDCGINYEDDPSSQNAYRLIGDVEFSSCSEKASFITPVPGGVGPMTVATLLANTFDSAKGQLQRSTLRNTFKKESLIFKRFLSYSTAIQVPLKCQSSNVCGQPLPFLCHRDYSSQSLFAKNSLLLTSSKVVLHGALLI